MSLNTYYNGRLKNRRAKLYFMLFPQVASFTTVPHQCEPKRKKYVARAVTVLPNVKVTF